MDIVEHFRRQLQEERARRVEVLNAVEQDNQHLSKLRQQANKDLQRLQLGTNVLPAGHQGHLQNPVPSAKLLQPTGNLGRNSATSQRFPTDAATFVPSTVRSMSVPPGTTSPARPGRASPSVNSTESFSLSPSSLASAHTPSTTPSRAQISPRLPPSTSLMLSPPAHAANSTSEAKPTPREGSAETPVETTLRDAGRGAGPLPAAGHGPLSEELAAADVFGERSQAGSLATPHRPPPKRGAMERGPASPSIPPTGDASLDQLIQRLAAIEERVLRVSNWSDDSETDEITSDGRSSPLFEGAAQPSVLPRHPAEMAETGCVVAAVEEAQSSRSPRSQHGAPRAVQDVTSPPRKLDFQTWMQERRWDSTPTTTSRLPTAALLPSDSVGGPRDVLWQVVATYNVALPLTPNRWSPDRPSHSLPSFAAPWIVSSADSPGPSPPRRPPAARPRDSTPPASGLARPPPRRPARLKPRSPPPTPARTRALEYAAQQRAAAAAARSVITPQRPRRPHSDAASASAWSTASSDQEPWLDQRRAPAARVSRPPAPPATAADQRHRARSGSVPRRAQTESAEVLRIRCPSPVRWEVTLASPKPAPPPAAPPDRDPTLVPRDEQLLRQRAIAAKKALERERLQLIMANEEKRQRAFERRDERIQSFRERLNGLHDSSTSLPSEAPPPPAAPPAPAAAAPRPPAPSAPSGSPPPANGKALCGHHSESATGRKAPVPNGTAAHPHSRVPLAPSMRVPPPTADPPSPPALEPLSAASPSPSLSPSAASHSSANGPSRQAAQSARKEAPQQPSSYAASRRTPKPRLSGGDPPVPTPIEGTENSEESPQMRIIASRPPLALHSPTPSASPASSTQRSRGSPRSRASAGSRTASPLAPKAQDSALSPSPPKPLSPPQPTPRGSASSVGSPDSSRPRREYVPQLVELSPEVKALLGDGPPKKGRRG